METEMEIAGEARKMDLSNSSYLKNPGEQTQPNRTLENSCSSRTGFKNTPQTGAVKISTSTPTKTSCNSVSAFIEANLSSLGHVTASTIPTEGSSSMLLANSTTSVTTPVSRLDSSAHFNLEPSTGQIEVDLTTTHLANGSTPIEESVTYEQQSEKETPANSALKMKMDRGIESIDSDSPVGARKLRKRKQSMATADLAEEAIRPLTDEERRAWKGWVELESDPALFNYILRQYGAKNVKIQEVFGLDDEQLSYLPRPVYGLVFLFKYRDGDAYEDFSAQECPEYIWFANQTTTNACATVALLNIIMNAPELDLGDNLNAFKESTKGLKPPYRGKNLDHDDFIRNIHNSFARKMDVLNADLALKHEYDKWVKSKKNSAKKPVKKQATPKRSKQQSSDEQGFHYVAYVPVQGEVWRLDGLQRHPVNLGPSNDSWVSVARDNIQQRTLQYEDDGVEFCLLALCKSPMRIAAQKLASNILSIQAVEKSLTKVVPDWRVFVQSNLAVSLNELSDTCGLSQDLVHTATSATSDLAKIEAVQGDPEKLMGFYQSLVKEQGRLRALYEEEVMVIGQEDAVAVQRKKDYTPLVYKAMKALAEAGVLKDIIKDLRQKDNKDI
ncbi:putative ubiquitin carboxyl-terminal hydrolase protein [Diplocarpon rosae]|nr:putative ubiquitin carboxyl-terminal hydrolase protein [Diplocarpon rosae]